MLSAKRLLPGRLPPYSSMVGVLNRQVDEARLRVDRDLGPHADVAGPFPRSVFPGVVAELTRAGIVLKRHNCLPVLMSNARTRPLAFVLYR
jgi:hypothetical protein